jgi:2-methylcitrate dehydratase PrpD
VTVAELLGQRGLTPLSDGGADTLRCLTLTNVAAAIGELGAAQRLIAALPLDGTRSSGDAAFVHAMRLHARTQDDFHPSGRVHIGAVALATALALPDRVGDRLLECLSAGYEVMCSVGSSYAPVIQQRGFRPSGIFAPLGAAATAALALGLDGAGIANAIALAAATSTGTNQSWIAGTDEWLLELGVAARAGVEAALFAEAGATGAPDALEGEAGWARAFCGDAAAAKLVAELAADRTRIAEVAVKPYPVSGIAQVPTHLGALLHDELDGIGPDSVIVRMSAAEANYPGSSNRGPFRSRSDALMSIAFCVATAVIAGHVPLEATEDANDRRLAAAIDRVQLEVDPSLPDASVVLTAEVGDRTLELAGRGSEIFHPTWAAISADLDGLARRCEAPVDVVREAREVLAAPAPDCRALARLMRERS